MDNAPLLMVLPILRRLRLPVTRDGAMLLLMAVTQFFLGLDTYLAHQISGTIVPREWIPIVFGPLAGVCLLAAGLLARRQRMAANLLATVVFLASIVVGVLGSYFHILRAMRPFAAAGQQLTLSLLVWAPPLLGPITFALTGVLGLSAAWQEQPVDSGTLILPGGRRLQMPLSKTRAYFFLVAFWMLATLLSAVLDHARSNFTNPFVWIPTVVGVFAMAVILALGIYKAPQRADYQTYVFTMLALMLVGGLGFVLHLLENMAGFALVWERVLRGAPLLAPLLFAHVGLMGCLVLLDPLETPVDSLRQAQRGV